MTNLTQYIASGITELYVLGLATPDQQYEIESLAADFIEIKNAIEVFSKQLEIYSLISSVEPDPVIKPMVMAIIDFMHRIDNGEKPGFPPLLTQTSAIHDYDEWLSRKDLDVADVPADVYAKIISHTPSVTTAIAWLKYMAPHEVHHCEIERFLIVEGSCDIMVEEKNHSLHRGDFFEIPLHARHTVKVTSAVACKVILQRIAA